MPRTRLLALLALVIGLALHGVGFARSWQEVRRAPHARDFASYHYAVKAAAQGLDPYDTAALDRLAREEGTRNQVYPFFYPPPFLLVMAWVLPLELAQAYRAWFWLDSLFLLAALLALWRWKPRDATLLGIALVLATLTAIPNNHSMGQANLPVLALTVWGAMLVDRRPRLAGALVGLACMLKMSPGLLVLWWLARGRWKAALAAVLSAVLLSLATLPLVDLPGQWRFYTEVLPSFGSGDYHGLSVPITLFGNHSLPNLWAQAFPAPVGLSGAARLGAGLTSLALVGALLWTGRRRDDELSALGVLTVLMLVIPAYTYEHHVVAALVPAVAVVVLLAERRLGWGWALILAPAWTATAWQLADWKAVALLQGPLLQWVMQEAKCASLLLLGAACWVGLLRARRSP